jgi:CubicO group peptidase (beta-lactamase class C family)
MFGLALPPNVPGVSLAIVEDFEVREAYGFGVRRTGSSDNVTPDTLFQACSVSKAVTALAVLRLVQEGALGLDEPANGYLKQWKVQSRVGDPAEVTVRRLLSHTAGANLPWSAGYHPTQDIPTLLQILAGEKPSIYPSVEVISPPGSRFEYSGGGYCILQQLLVDLKEKPFPELMRELVLDPLDMVHSTFEQPLPGHLEASAAVGHREDGKPVRGAWRVYPEMALGGLWTTPTDLARIGIVIQRALNEQAGTLLSGQIAREMLAAQADAGERGSVGLGVFIEGAGPTLRFGHPGDNEGYSARWISSVIDGRGVVVMTNSDAGWLVQEELISAVASEYRWPEG